MALEQGLTLRFLEGLLRAEFDLSADTTQTYKLALYSSAAALSASTAAYTTEGEVVGTGYTAGGATLSISVGPTRGTTGVYMGFADPSWSAASFSARGALLYLADGSENPSVLVLDFGADKTATVSQPFYVRMPPTTLATALIRVIRRV